MSNNAPIIDLAGATPEFLSELIQRAGHAQSGSDLHFMALRAFADHPQRHLLVRKKYFSDEDE